MEAVKKHLVKLQQLLEASSQKEAANLLSLLVVNASDEIFLSNLSVQNAAYVREDNAHGQDSRMRAAMENAFTKGYRVVVIDLSEHT